MKKLLLFLLLTTAAWASPPPTTFPVQIRTGATDPATCTPSNKPGERNLFWNTTTGDLKECRTANTWSYFLSGSSAFNYVATSLATNDMLKYDGTNWINMVPGLATKRTDTTANVTYVCSNATGDDNKVVIRSYAGAATDTVPAAGVSCPDGTNIFVLNTNTDPTRTITLQTGSTAILPANSFTRLRSNGTTWEVSTALVSQEHVISWTITATGDAKAYIPIYFACTVYATDVTADASGSFAFEIHRRNAAIPDVTGTYKISGTDTGGNLSGAQLNLAHAPASWGSTALVPGDVLDVNVTTWTTVTNVHLQLRCH